MYEFSVLRSRLGDLWGAFRASPETPSTNLANPDSWLWDAFGAQQTGSGIHVTEDTALRLTAVYACIGIHADMLSSLPLKVYRKTNQGREEADDHDVYPVIHDQWNEYMTSAVGRSMMQSHAVGRGNTYALIERDAGGFLVGLWPVPSPCMEPIIEGGRVWYRVTQSGRDILGVGPGVYAAEDVLHVPGMGYDGLCGYSPLKLARESIALGLAAESFGSRFFGNGSRAGGILTADQPIDEQNRKRLKAEWQAVHEGVANSHKTAILGNGLKYQAISVSPEDAQFLETRRFQVAEIARLFRVPPHLVGDVERSTSWGTGIVEQNIGFISYTLRPWLVRWEQEMNRKLFTKRERSRYFVEFNVDGLLRGDIKTRFEAYQIATMNGWLNADEIRGRENLNPIPDGNGEKFYRPANLVEVGAPSKPAPAPVSSPGGIQ